MGFFDFIRKFFDWLFRREKTDVKKPDTDKPDEDLPDLVIKSYKCENDSVNSKIMVVVGNIGNAPSTQSRVYCNAINPTPPSGQNEIRVHLGKDLPPIEAGGSSLPLEIRFEVAKLTSENVSRIDVNVDPKNEVKESDESNNLGSWNWPGDCT